MRHSVCDKMVRIETLTLSTTNGRYMQLHIILMSLLVIACATFTNTGDTHSPHGDESTLPNAIPTVEESSSISSALPTKNYVVPGYNYKIITKTTRPCYDMSCTFVYSSEMDIIINGAYSQEPVQTIDEYFILTSTKPNSLMVNNIASSPSFAPIASSILAYRVETPSSSLTITNSILTNNIESSSPNIGSHSPQPTYIFVDTDKKTNGQLSESNMTAANTTLVTGTTSTSSSVLNPSRLTDNYTSKSFRSLESSEAVNQINDSPPKDTLFSLAKNEGSFSQSSIDAFNKDEDYTTKPSFTTVLLTANKESVSSHVRYQTLNGNHYKASNIYSEVLTEQTGIEFLSPTSMILTPFSILNAPEPSTDISYLQSSLSPSCTIASDKRTTFSNPVNTFPGVTYSNGDNSANRSALLPDYSTLNKAVRQDLAIKTSSIPSELDVTSTVTLEWDVASEVTSERDVSSAVTLEWDVTSEVTSERDVSSAVTLEWDVASEVTSERGVSSAVTLEWDVTSEVTSERDVSSAVTLEWDVASEVTSERDVSSAVTLEWDVASEVTSERDVSSAVTLEWDVTSEVTPERDVSSAASSERDVSSAASSERHVSSAASSERHVSSAASSERHVSSAAASERDVTSVVTSEWDVTSPGTVEQDLTSASTSERSVTSAVTLTRDVTSAVTLEWGMTLLTSENTIDHLNSSTTLGATSGGYEFVGTSKVMTDSSSNTTFCCLQIEKSPNEDADWAVPVAVCLSVLLVVTWVILVVVCLRLKQMGAASSGEEDAEEHRTADSQARHQEMPFQGPSPFSDSGLSITNEQNTHKKTGDQQRFHPRDKQKNASLDFRTANDSRTMTPAIREDNQEFELEDILSKDMNHRDSYKRYRKQHRNRDLRIESNPWYDNHSFISNSPPASKSSLATSHNLSNSNNTELSQHVHQYSTNTKGQIPHPASFNHMRQRVSKEETQIISGTSYLAQRSDQHPVDIDEGIKANNMTAFTNTNSRHSRQDNLRDEYNSEDNYEDTRNYITGDSKGSVKHIASDEEDGFMVAADLDCVDKTCYGIATRSAMGGKRHGMSKCASFDDNNYRVGDGGLNKYKSPTRKISTTSDTATTYLTPPEHGYMTMASCYETVNNLAEAWDPSSGSRFFIGSSSDNIHLFGRSVTVSRDKLNSDTKTNSDDFGEFNKNKNSYSEMDLVETISTQKNSSDEYSERLCSKPTDDYIFPIVRKANMKIMADRQQRKLVENQSSGNQDDDDMPLTDTQTMPKRADTKSKVLTRDEKSDPAMGKASLPSTKMYVAANTKPSRRVSYPLQIPKIILTKDNEMLVECDNRNEAEQLTSERPPRVKRIARANNPFLIEVRSPEGASEEKVRRSSAPAMPRQMEFAEDIAANVRMIRSASGDHLCLNPRQEHLHRLQTKRPWSSEFFDLIQNSRRETRSDDERLKKMIDDRYNALFSNKYSPVTTTNRYQNPSSVQDLSLRAMKFASDYSPSSLTHGATVNVLSTETRSRFKPILEARISEAPLDRHSNIPPRIDEGRMFITSKPGSQTEIVIKSVSSADPTVKEGSGGTLPSEFPNNAKPGFLDDRNSRSPRPSLAQGTDGQDSDTDTQKGASWKEDSLENKARPFNDEGANRIVDDEGEKRATNIKWKSFDDDLGSGSKSSGDPFQETTLTKDRGPSYRLSSILDQSSKVTERDDPTVVKKEYPSPVRYSPRLIKEGHKGKHHTRLTNKDPDIVTRAFYPPTSNHEEYAFTSSLHFQAKYDSVEPGSSYSGFDDNFDTTNNFNHTNYEESLKNKPAQELAHNKPLDMNTSLQINTSVKPTEKSTRVHATKTPKSDKFKRPPPQNFFEANKKTLDEDHREDSSTKNTFLSGSEDNINFTNPKPALKVSSTDFKHERVFPKWRSRSLDVPANSEIARIRAITLETDKPRSPFGVFDDWPKLFSEAEPTFVTSANNTLLEHTNQEGIQDLNDSVSEPELELYFGTKASPVDSNRKSRHQTRAKLLLLSDDDDSNLQVSVI